jgi:hypothetical protein
VADDEDKKKKEEIEAAKEAGKRAWKIHQGKKNASKGNGKPVRPK